MKDIDARNNAWNASPVSSDVWSAKNSLFTDYSELSAQFEKLRLAQQLELTKIASPQNIRTAVQAQPKTSENNIAKLPAPCRPLDISAANLDELSNDSVLTTPAGFYDRSPPLLSLSIPPLYERDETGPFLDLERKTFSSSSASSSIVTGSSDDIESTCSTRCSSPASTAGPENSTMNVMRRDESRFCDRLVCSVLSQVISDDFCNDACLLSEIESIEDDSDRSNASSPSAETSTLNPLAPAFRAKPKSRSTTKQHGTPSFRAHALSSPMQLTYMQPQIHTPVAWTYLPAYYAPSYPRSNSRKQKSPLMHYTPLPDGTGVWTQYSDQGPAYGCPTVVYPTRINTSQQWTAHRQQVCVLPHPCVGLVELGYHVGLPAGSKYLPVRQTRRSHPTPSHKSARGPA